MKKTKVYRSSEESYSPSQCHLNMALKYQEKEGSIWVSIFRCRFKVLLRDQRNKSYCQNPNSTQANITLSWVRLENDFAYHPTPPQKLNVCNISAVTDPIWWNFRGRLLGTSRTDSSCHSDICPGNICPGYICLYQEYLNCYWPDFDETLKVSFGNI